MKKLLQSRFATAVKLSVLLVGCLLLSCNKTEDGITAEVEATQSYNVSKALYSAIRLSTKRDLSDLGYLLDADLKSKLGASSEEYKLLHHPKLGPLMAALNPSAKARVAEGPGSVGDELSKLLSSAKMTYGVKKKMLELNAQIQSLKGGKDSDVEKSVVKKLSDFEETVHKDKKLDLNEKQFIFTTTVILKDNAKNYVDLASKLVKGAKTACWLCRVVNIVVTVVIVTVVTVVVVAVVIGGGGLVLGVAAVSWGVLAIGATALGIIAGSTFAAQDICVTVIDYGQDLEPFPGGTIGSLGMFYNGC